MKIPVVTIFLLLVGISGTAAGLDCSTLNKLGKGELGPPPRWLIPYCTGEAESLENKLKKAYPDQKFTQVYEALVNEENLGEIAHSLNLIMQKAGYKYISSNTRGEVLNLNYANTSTRNAYAVFVGPKKIDYFLVLIKTKL